MSSSLRASQRCVHELFFLAAKWKVLVCLTFTKVLKLVKQQVLAIGLRISSPLRA